jgi:hypothetical protein
MQRIRRRLYSDAAALLRDLNLSNGAPSKKERTHTQKQQRKLPQFHRFPHRGTSSQMIRILAAETDG